jgi:hypothetical protein
MKKVILIFVLLSGAFFCANAQNIITTKGGEEIRAKVIEKSTDVIRYQLYEAQSEQFYVLNKSEVKMIKYESGRTETFDSETTAATSTTPATAVAKPATYSAKPATVSAKPATASTVRVTTPTEKSEMATLPLDWKIQMQRNAPDLYRNYVKKTNLKNFGIGFAIGGAIAIVVGAATGEKKTTASASGVQVQVGGTGGAVAAAGIACVISGTVMAVIGKSKSKAIKQQYAERYGNTTFHKKSPLQSPHLEIRANGLAFVF